MVLSMLGGSVAAIEDYERALKNCDLAARPIYEFTERALARGELQQTPSVLLHMCAVGGSVAATVPDEWLPTNVTRPDGIELPRWSKLVFWADLHGRNDLELFAEWHTYIAVGTACMIEIEDRLKRFPVGAQLVHVKEEDEQALRDAIQIIEKRIRPISAVLPSDEIPSVLNFAIGKLAAKRTSLGLFFDAVDGRCERAVTDRFRDERKRALAQKRTYDQYDDSNRTKQPERPLTSDEIPDVVLTLPAPETDRPSFELDRKLGDQDLKPLGPSGQLVRFYLDNPDGDRCTDAEIAAKIELSEKSVQRYRKQLRTTHRDTVLRLIHS